MNYEASCTECGLFATSDAHHYVNRAAGEHYAEECGAAVSVDTPREVSDAGLLSVCIDCGFTYHHGGTGSYVDMTRADDHRRHGGDTMAEYDLVDREPERHAVALLDLEHGTVLTEPTTERQQIPRSAMPTVEGVRDR